MFDQAKMVMQARKLQKQLANELIEVTAGGDAVKVVINGEQKIKKISLNPDYLNPNRAADIEQWLEAAVREAINRSQASAAEKMKPLLGNMGGFGR
ncbi:MAG: YbaB/EbfC family DNA-binding protein [Candidatus Chaera renei]|uniref:YbaB/EbfC family DNA-binding protein n=1 Tax=Candidatus Chaera renei TaxID=2506947 RepID=A0A4Q0AIN1_9BACT|nr:MAG: YbaB/EbfC family DNA-binding protein [Candidatus Chaera renei]